jgi:predicted Zn finger-like uncharacterized protein
MAKMMRLICPNCSAEYEVDETVIPEAGRDVQCSHCNHVWWQMRTPAPAEAMAKKMQAPAAAEASAKKVQAPASAEAPAEKAAAVPKEGLKHSASRAPKPPSGPAQMKGPGKMPGFAPPPTMGGEKPAEEPPAPPREEPKAAPAPEPVAVAADIPAAPRRSLDDAVLDVLRQEAQREAESREKEAEAKAKADADAEAAAALAAKAAEEAEKPRSSTLPDVEMINSTLDGEEESGAAASRRIARLQTRRRVGFRMGFAAMILLALGVAGVYAYGDRLADRWPEFAPQIAAFRERVDRGRAWLDMAALDATAAIQGMSEDNP